MLDCSGCGYRLKCLRAMCSAISIGHHGMLQPITMTMRKINMTKSHFNCCSRFKFSTLMARNRCDRHIILKDNSWICILHQYHKANGLKACTAMCRNYAVNIILLIQDGGTHGGRGCLAVMKEYEIITLKYNGKACRLYLLCFCASRI